MSREERENLEKAQARLERIHTSMLDVEEILLEAGRDDLTEEYTTVTESISEFLVTLAGEIDRTRGDSFDDEDDL